MPMRFSASTLNVNAQRSVLASWYFDTRANHATLTAVKGTFLCPVDYLALHINSNAIRVSILCYYDLLVRAVSIQ